MTQAVSRLAVLCDRRGRIAFQPAERPDPKGRLRLGVVPADARDRVEALARLAYDNATLLVPGIPEARNDQDALEAAWEFSDRIVTRVLARELAAGGAA